MINYFDSSVLLAILFDEKNFEKAWNNWSSSSARVSSILLKIETNVSLQRYYKNNIKKLDNNWFRQKEKVLDSLLNDVFYKTIEEDFVDVIAKNKSITGCKSLDAIHLATALYFSENSRENNIVLCSFDKKMLSVAKELGFETNG